MKEYIRLRVVRTVEEIVEYTPERLFHGSQANLAGIAESVMTALAKGVIVPSDLESLGESELAMRVEIIDYGTEDAETYNYKSNYELDPEEGLIEDEY